MGRLRANARTIWSQHPVPWGPWARERDTCGNSILQFAQKVVLASKGSRLDKISLHQRCLSQKKLELELDLELQRKRERGPKLELNWDGNPNFVFDMPLNAKPS